MSGQLLEMLLVQSSPIVQQREIRRELIPSVRGHHRHGDRRMLLLHGDRQFLLAVATPLQIRRFAAHFAQNRSEIEGRVRVSERPKSQRLMQPPRV